VRIIGTLLLAAVIAIPMQARAGDLLESVNSAVAATAQQGRPPDARDWQRRYDRAQSRKGGGKSKMVLGAVVLAGGIGLRPWAVGRCTGTAVDFSNPEATIAACSTAANLVNVANIVNLSGVGVFGWGLAQYITANGELRRLEESRPGDAMLGPGTNGAQFASVAPSLSYTVRW
jgi:hypothetical protein